MRKNILVFVFLLSGIISFGQSPWTKKKNGVFVQIGGSSISYKNVKINGVSSDSGRSNSDVTSQLYAEYGITDKLEATVILPYKFLSYKDNTTNISQSVNGLSNTTVGFKYLVIDKKFKVSGGVLFQANTIDKDPIVGFRTGFDANTILPYVTAGSSWKKLYYYANAGYGYMDSGYSDYLKVYGEVGYEVFSKFHIIGLFELKSLISDGSVFNSHNSNYLLTANYLDRQEYLATGLKVNYEFIKDKYGFNFSSIGAVAFDNTPAAGSMNVGLYAKF